MKAQEYWQESQKYLTGGVSSSFRYNPFTGHPMYLSKAEGPYIYDLDGKQFIDFFMGHGACTLGHNRLEIAEAMKKVFDIGFFAEFDHPLTSELAKKITQNIPSAERIRYVNSGSEATLLSIRLARGYTGRQKIVRIDGHFHGGHDYALLNNLAAFVDRDNPGNRLSKIQHSSAGVPVKVDDTLYVIPWNNAEVFEELCKDHGHEIAAILMNPIDYNNGCIGSSTEYLQAIRKICDDHGILFIIDEILSGFRTGMTGGHGYYGVTPDLCLFGKALTNGVPLAAVAGRERIMMKIMDPVDPVVAGGTFSGNLFGCAAGIEALTIMEQPDFFATWLKRVEDFYVQLQSIFDEADFPAIVQGLGCTFGIYVGTREPVTNYHHIAERTDPELRKTFFSKCIEKGLYFHTDFTISAQHDEALLTQSLELLREAARETKREM
ncbi:MAG TPA: aminotransferase class III-fold pyridoxal phosphate-dependent enzyme [Anaerolineales bacterium]|nr:aminotransferase class III-fold pyridoxal phosphate-dependent enzyme [Anaerolineales bacterium]